MIRRLSAFILPFLCVCSLGAAAPTTRPIVAVFDLSGELTEQPVDNSMPLFGPQPQSLREVVSHIDKAAKDPSVKAVVILAGEAELGFAQTAEIRQAMQNLRTGGKEIYAHADALMMPQYVIASGATHLSVSPTGEVWAMGLYGDQLYLRGLLTKIGVTPDFLHCGAYKSASEIFMRDGPSPEADEMYNWLFDSIFDTAIGEIASGRNVSADQVHKWIDGGPYTAEKAKSIGMIDAVEDRTELEASIKSKFGDDVQFDKKYGEEKQPEINFSNPFAVMQVFAQLMNPPKKDQNKPAIGIVYVEGPIVTGKSDSSPFGSQLAASTDISRALDDAAADDSIKAVVLRVDSPGGSATASEIILHATERLKAKKPLIVSMGDVAGSGGYFVTCAADTVFADDATITASIGVVGGKLVTTDMWNKIGVNWHAYSRGANAGLLSTDTVFSDSQRTQMQAWMDEIYGVFKGHVVSIRGSKLKKPIDQLAAGRVFTGKQALDLGLVDRIGTLADAISFAADQAKVSDYTVRTVPEPKNFLQKLMEQSAGGDNDPDRISVTTNQNWLIHMAAPYLAGIDQQHLAAINMALGQLELMQQEQVILMMPAPYCMKAGSLK
jgi:protease-4